LPDTDIVRNSGLSRVYLIDMERAAASAALSAFQDNWHGMGATGGSFLDRCGERKYRVVLATLPTRARTIIADLSANRVPELARRYSPSS